MTLYIKEKLIGFHPAGGRLAQKAAALLFSFVFICLIFPTFIYAEESEETLSFPISAFDVEGNTILTDEEVARVTAPFVGGSKNFGTVQQALEALEKAYADIGFSTVLVALPEQRLQDGVVKFKVIEGRLAHIEVAETQFFDEANAINSLPKLEIGKTPNIDDLAANLTMIGENPAKRANVVFKPGENEGDVVANVKMVEQDPLRMAVTLDNTGTLKTGLLRIGYALQYANLFNRDHVLTAQAVTAPEEGHYKDVKIFAASYHMPIYSWGASIDALLGYSSVDSGDVRTSVGNFAISGSGNVYEIHFNKQLPRLAGIEHKLSTGFSYRLFKTSVNLVDTTQNLVPPTTIHPLDLTYSFSKSTDIYNLNGYLSLVQNVPFGTHGKTDDFSAFGVRPGSRASYSLARYGLDFSYLYKTGWQWRFKFVGQTTGDLLVPGEQFGIGGQDSIRGLEERAFSNDRGFQSTFEVYTPEFGSKLFKDVRMRALAFMDTGQVLRNQPAVDETAEMQITSSGLGIRASYQDKISLRLDVAHIKNDRDVLLHDDRVHAQIAWTF